MSRRYTARERITAPLQEAVISLDKLGIEPVPRGALAYADLYRAAKRVRDSKKQVVGLLPANPTLSIAEATIQLGLALGDACQEPVAVIDANTKTPAFASCLPGAVAATGFVLVWLRERLALVTPAGARKSGVDFASLETILARDRARFRHLLVLLGGFEELGEHLGAAELCDGVVILARAGVSDEDELLARRDEVGSRLLGVLLLR